MQHPVFHRRNLPHLHPSQGIFFITYRLVDSMPKDIIEKLHNEFMNKKEELIIQPNKHSYFVAFDEYMDRYKTDKSFLSIPEVAEINKKALHHFDLKYYQLICYCIMSNHVHLVIKLTDEAPDLSQIMHSIKRYTAKESNIILNKKGAFWMKESYDHLIRSEKELRNVVNYVINNPIKAGLTEHWGKWPHTFIRLDLLN
jgi:putative transposase